MASDTLTWLEDMLKAERKQVELTLATRHAVLLKELAPMLENSKTTGIPASHAAIVDAPASRNRQLRELRKEEAAADDNEGMTWSGCLPCSARPPPAPVESDMIGNDPLEVDAPKETVEDGEALVPTDDDEEQRQPWRIRLGVVLDHWIFDAFIGAVIVANSCCIGAESTYKLECKDTTVFAILEHIFLVIYIIELVLRFAAFGKQCFSNAWVMFDFLLVCVGIVSLYIIEPIAASQSKGVAKSCQDTNEMAGLMVLRMLRLFRLARLVRLMVTFKTLWMLIRGLLGSVGTICYTFLLIFLILYIFSCMSLELITATHRNSDVTEIQDLVQTYFPNLQVTMLSLVQFVTIDSLAGFYFPLIIEDPKLILFFVPFILVVSISMMNLVTAVIVEGAIEQGQQDAESRKLYAQSEFKKMLPGLRARFAEMDADGNALLTVDEILNAPDDIKDDLSKYCDPSELRELFEMIDVDESGEINCDEFCDGIFKLVNSEAPVELIRILKQLKIVRRELADLKSGNWITEANFGPRLSQSSGDLTNGDNVNAGAV